MEISKDAVWEACRELNLWGLNDIVADLLKCEEITKDMDVYDLGNKALDNLIWEDDKWAILKAYQSPDNANWEEAMELFYNDLYRVCEYLIENAEEEEE